MKTKKNQTGRKCDYCPSKDASPLTLKNLTVVSSCESCYESGAFKSAKPTHTPGPWQYEGKTMHGRDADGEAVAILLAALKNIAGLATYKRGVDSADPSDMRDDLEGIKEAAVSAILRATEGK